MRGKLLIAGLLTFAAAAGAGSAVAFAAGVRQEQPPADGAMTAMHAACESGDLEAMRAAMTVYMAQQGGHMAMMGGQAGMSGGAHDPTMGAADHGSGMMGH